MTKKEKKAAAQQKKAEVATAAAVVQEATPAVSPKAEKKEVAKSEKKESTKAEKKEAAKAEKKESKPVESKEPPVEKKADDKIRTLPNGMILEDTTIGTGPRAVKGKRVGMRYIGKLTNGKVFDSNTKGKPFSFKLGKGEVIKGWDIGIAGMNVGGSRRLTIPAALAYGSQGAPPDIPRNATLIFDVKLLEVKN